MTYPRSVSARLLDTDGTTVVSGTPLANAFDLTFMDELNGEGTGTCSLSLSEAGSAELTPGRFVQILVEGTARFTFMIEGDPEYKVVGEGEEIDQIVTVSGRGWGCVLDTAIVSPVVDLALNLDSSWRVFSFASPDFPNDGAWAAADELYEYLEALSYPNSTTPYRAPVALVGAGGDNQRYPAPIGFPFNTSPNVLDVDVDGDYVKLAEYVDTFWIWPTGEELSLGYAFFRRTLTVANDGTYTFAITADNYFTLFVEGIPILGEQALHGIWKFWKEAEIGLPVGTYQIGVVVENVPLAPGAVGSNPGGLIMTVHTLDSTQLPNEAILVTDDQWTCVFADDFWPGWTPGQIIATVVGEATTRGALAAYAGDTFADSTDSSSAAWADAVDGQAYVPAFAAEVGSTIMAMLSKMVDEGYIDWHVQPGTLTLDVWAPGNVGTTPGVSLVAGTNLMTLERGATGIYANALLVQWERGYVWVTDADEIAAFGSRVEDIYSSEAATRNEAIRIGAHELNQRIASGWPAIVATVEPVDADDCPYEGFGLGDTITIPAVGGGTENVQVLAIHLETDELGYAIWRVELNRRWRSRIRENYELLREIGGRSGKGYGVVEG